MRQWLSVLRPLVRGVRRAARTAAIALERPLTRLVLAVPHLPLPAWLLVPVAHTATDRDALERIAARTTPRVTAGRAGRGSRRLHQTALLRRARLALDARDDHDALHWFDRAHDESGPTPNTWTWRAVTLRRLGRLEESRLAGEQAALAEPGWCPAIVHLGILYQQLGDRARSVACWRRLLDASGATPAELRWAWIGATRARDFELALAFADRLERETDGAPFSSGARAATLWALGRRDEAELLCGVLERDGSPDAVRAAAFALGRTGRSEQAYALLRRLPATELAADAMLELIYALREDGHLRLAVQAAEEAADVNPDHPEIRQARMLASGVLRVFVGERPSLDDVPPPPHAAATTGPVLHVVGRTLPDAGSGYAVRTHHTVRAQRARGIDAQVVSQVGFPWEDGRDAPAVEDVDGVTHHRLAIPADARLPLPLDERLARNVDALTALAEELQPALLHAASDFRNGLLGAVVAGRLGIPWIYEMRGFWEETWLSRHGEHAIGRDMYVLRRARELEVAQRASYVFTLAPTMRDALVERGLDPDRVGIAPNAVAPDDFPIGGRDDTIAAELGLAAGEVVVGYVSSFVGYEGIHVLIDAVARLVDDGVAVRGLLVGDGAVRPELERQARDRGVADRIVFTGRVPHQRIAAYYGLIDVFVVPRTNARVCRLVSPLKPYEAMAARRAVIVSGTPVLRTIVEDGVTGLVFEPEDPEDLARKVRELVHDPDRRERLGEAARAHVLANHTWDANAERYVEVYRRLGVV